MAQNLQGRTGRDDTGILRLHGRDRKRIASPGCRLSQQGERALGFREEIEEIWPGRRFDGKPELQLPMTAGTQKKGQVSMTEGRKTDFNLEDPDWGAELLDGGQESVDNPEDPDWGAELLDCDSGICTSPPKPNSLPPQKGAASSTHARASSPVRLVLGAFLVGVVLFFAPSVWRPGQQAPSGQPEALPQQQSVVEAQPRPQEDIQAVQTVPPPPAARVEQRALVRGQVDRNKAPARLPKALSADQVFEQRLGTSEADLVRELLAVAEVRVVSDDDVRKVRAGEQAARAQAEAEARAAQARLEAPARVAQEAARARADAANARIAAAGSAMKGNLGNQALARAFQDAVRDSVRIAQENARAVSAVTAATRLAAANVPLAQGKIGYDFDLRLHQTMKRTAVQTGFVLQSESRCQLDTFTAGEVAKLSKELRDNGFVSAPGRRSATDLQAWCDQQDLEGTPGTVPTLTQLLQVEDEAKRLLLVRELTRIRSADATTQLAVRAIVDLSPAVRQAALAGLEQRSSQRYLPVLLGGLRYPWPPVADHAAVALRTLHPREAVGSLVDLLDLPSPSDPVLDPKTKQYTVRQVVRLNHLRNCLLCHPPSANKDDGPIRGLVPTPGLPLPVAYYEGPAPGSHFVRADISYLRQDFSVTLPDEHAAPWPRQQRFDFLTRLRTVSPGSVPARTESSSDYPQRGAVLYALRGLTGKDAGDSSTSWRKLLGLIGREPEGDRQGPALEKLTRSLADPNGPR
jgi:hypothetical protein